MDFLEKDLEQIIYQTLKSKNGYGKLYKRGLCFSYDQETMSFLKLKRQVGIGNYGTADILAVNRYQDCPVDNLEPFLEISIFELKKNIINIDTLLQVAKYYKGIKRYIEDYRNKCFDLHFNLILIGKEVDINSDFIYLFDIFNSLEYIHFYTFLYDYNFDGIKFTETTLSDYKLSDEGF